MIRFGRNSNKILTIVEIVGFVGSLATTARAAPKVADKIKKLPRVRHVKNEVAPGVYSHEIEQIPNKERALMIARACFPECITPLIFSSVTLCAMVGTRRQFVNQQTAIASSYTMAKRLYDENKEKVNKLINDISPLDPNNPSALAAVEESMNGDPKDRNEVFFLEYSGRRFKSSRADVEEALELLDEQFQKTGLIKFNDLYLYLGIAESKLGVENGFIDWYRLNYPDHQESEHLEWEIRGVTRATGINPEDAKKLEDNGEVIYMISFANTLEGNISFYQELVAAEEEYSRSL